MLFILAGGLLAAAALLLLKAAEQDKQQQQQEPAQAVQEPAQPEPAEQAPAEQAAPAAKTSFWQGPARKERAAFAQQQGFVFTPKDGLLGDEFRGIFPGGSPATNVVSGSLHGTELHFFTLGSKTLLAARGRRAHRYRIEFAPAPLSAEVIAVEPMGSFTCFANDVAVTRRFLDARVAAALEVLVPHSTGIILTGHWTIVQLQRRLNPELWPELMQATALLAAAAATLPPRSGQAARLDLTAILPTRPLVSRTMLARTASASGGETPWSEELAAEDLYLPPVRTEIVLPNRVYSAKYGVDPAETGAGVPVIGDDPTAVIAEAPAQPDNAAGMRLVRRDLVAHQQEQSPSSER